LNSQSRRTDMIALSICCTALTANFDITFCTVPLQHFFCDSVTIILTFIIINNNNLVIVAPDTVGFTYLLRLNTSMEGRISCHCFVTCNHVFFQIDCFTWLFGFTVIFAALHFSANYRLVHGGKLIAQHWRVVTVSLQTGCSICMTCLLAIRTMTVCMLWWTDWFARSWASFLRMWPGEVWCALNCDFSTCGMHLIVYLLVH